LLVDASERQFVVLGRLAPGFRRAHAQAELDHLALRLDPASADRKVRTRVLVDAHTEMEPGFRQDLTNLASIQFTAAILLLLIATSNVANMLLARAADSAKDIAVRLALGAGRARIIRQILLESVMVAFAGAIGGMIFAVWLIRLTQYMLPSDLPPDMIAIRQNRSLLLTTATAAIAGLLSGVAPAWQTSVRDLWTQ
jgi:ABC-type lipoprotein release transport system permease subunit